MFLTHADLLVVLGALRKAAASTSDPVDAVSYQAVAMRLVDDQ